MKRIRYLSIAYVLFFSLLAFSIVFIQTQAFAEDVDVTPPVLTNVILGTDIVTAPGTAEVTIVASDDISGLSYASVYFVNPETNGKLFRLDLQGIDENGNLTGAIYVSEGTNAGNYIIHHIQIYDKAGNSSYYIGEGNENFYTYEQYGLAVERLPDGCTALTINVINGNLGMEINETVFPDYNFRYYVSSNCDIDGNGFLSESEIANTTDIQCADCGIGSLEGIKVFSALHELNCSTNFLTELDLSGLTELNYLDCSSNQLTNIDLTGCSALSDFWCYDNELTSLDLRGYPALCQVICNNNKLTSLDVSQCSELRLLHCLSNQLLYLNVSGCVQLVRLLCYDNQLTSLDICSCPKLDCLKCQSNLVSSLDIRWCPALLDVYRTGNGLGPDWTQSVASYCYPDNFSFPPLLTLDRSVTVYYDFLIDEVIFPDTSFLPSSLSVVEEESFSNSSFVNMFVPESIREIKSRAFANCTSLHTVVFTNASVTIEPDAFIGCSNLTIIAPAGGWIEVYAKENDIPFISIRTN